MRTFVVTHVSGGQSHLVSELIHASNKSAAIQKHSSVRGDPEYDWLRYTCDAMHLVERSLTEMCVAVSVLELHITSDGFTQEIQQLTPKL